MKKIILSLFLIGINNSIHGQATAPIGNAWAANKYLGFDGSNNINPLLFRTNAINRMKLNGNTSYGINSYPVSQKNGFLLFGISNNSFSSGLNNYTSTAQGAYSLLHLNGSVNSAVGNAFQEFGYRPWMETGVSLTGNRDFAYFGLRPVGTFGTSDRTETVFLWSDNGAGGGPDTGDGPDNMVFRFSGFGGTDGATVNANRLSTTDLDNMRFIFTGNTFGANPDGAPSMSQDGLEMMRLYPATVYEHFIYDSLGIIVDTLPSYGRVGVGDFTVAGVNQPPTHKIRCNRKRSF